MLAFAKDRRILWSFIKWPGSLRARLARPFRSVPDLLVRVHSANSPEGVRRKLGKMFERLGWALSLSREQEQRIASLLDRLAPELYALAEQRREVNDALEYALLRDPVDEAAVEKEQHELSLLAERASELSARAFSELTSVFTAEQRRLLARQLPG